MSGALPGGGGLGDSDDSIRARRRLILNAGRGDEADALLALSYDGLADELGIGWDSIHAAVTRETARRLQP